VIKNNSGFPLFTTVMQLSKGSALKRTQTLARIGIRSSVLRMCMVTAAMGFVLGAVLSFVAAVFTSAASLGTGIDLTRFGIALVILLPIAGAFLSGLAGALLTFLFVLIYNLTAGLFGGIRVECEEEREKRMAGEKNFLPSRRMMINDPR